MAAASTYDTNLERVWNEIRDLGLEPYVAELDAMGYTVIPPEIANPDGLCERMLEAVLNIAERRNGERPDMETGSTHAHLGVETTAQAREKGPGKLRGRLPSVSGKEIDSPPRRPDAVDLLGEPGVRGVDHEPGAARDGDLSLWLRRDPVGHGLLDERPQLQQLQSAHGFPHCRRRCRRSLTYASAHTY